VSCLSPVFREDRYEKCLPRFGALHARVPAVVISCLLGGGGALGFPPRIDRSRISSEVHRVRWERLSTGARERVRARDGGPVRGHLGAALGTTVDRPSRSDGLGIPDHVRRSQQRGVPAEAGQRIQGRQPDPVCGNLGTGWGSRLVGGSRCDLQRLPDAIRPERRRRATRRGARLVTRRCGSMGARIPG
jgi:hypothetical protein